MIGIRKSWCDGGSFKDINCSAQYIGIWNVKDYAHFEPTLKARIK